MKAIQTIRSSMSIALIGVSLVLFGACSDKKEAEDVARIRQLMEEKKAEEEAAKLKSKAKFAEIRKNAEQSGSAASR